MKPKPPTTVLTYRPVVIDPYTSAHRQELASCTMCRRKLLPGEENYLQRINGLAIVCNKHYKKMRRFYDEQ